LFFWRNPKTIQKQIDAVLGKAQRSGLLDASSREMMENILKFAHTLVREIMIPRTEIVAVNIEEDIGDILEDIISSRHAYIPVYRSTIDNIIGILNVKDILEFLMKKISKDDILAILRPPYYIPETKNTHLLFYEFKENKKHMAIVIDEYGGTAGLVTLEDLLEEIVGELRDADETVSENEEILQLPDGSFLCEGRTEIEKIEEALSVNLEKGRFETLGGWILHHTKRIPLTAETFQLEGLDIAIESADERRIKKVKIKKRKQVPSYAEET
jgi:CBS domain containing-hemolysin-like protein